MAVNKRPFQEYHDQDIPQDDVKRRCLSSSITTDLRDASNHAGSTPSNTPDAQSQYSSIGKRQDGNAASVTTAASTKRPKTLICVFDGCGKAFDRPARLEIHIRSHTNERPFACTEPDCDKTFLRNEHLKAHIKSKHNDERNYTCTYTIGTDDDGEAVQCGKSFHTGQRLRRHVAAHEEKEQTKCQECGQVFRKMETLQRHVKSVHLNEDAYRCQHIDEADAMQEECGQTFASMGQLKAHEAREHGAKRYACNMCPEDLPKEFSFTTYAELQDHIRSVHPPTCQQCGHVCATVRELKAHMEIVHSTLTSRQRFECDHPGCDRKFTKRGNLQVHIQSVHGKIKAFICGQTDLSSSKKVEGWSGIGCGASLGSKAALESHVRTQHLGLPVHDNVFSKTRHAQYLAEPDVAAASSITGLGYEIDRPIACYETICDFRFNQEHDLAIHLELHHGWQIDDVNDAILENAALEGERFWVARAYGQDTIADCLSRVLADHNQLGEAEEEGLAVEPSAMLIDPTLTAV